MASVRGINRKYSTENSTTPTWKLGISSVNNVARPYRAMVSTNTISFWDWVAVCFFASSMSLFLSHTVPFSYSPIVIPLCVKPRPCFCKIEIKISLV